MTDLEVSSAAASVTLTLAQYARAVDRRDAHAVAQILSRCEVVFKGSPVMKGADIEQFYAAAFQQPTEVRTLHAVLATSATVRGDTAVYEAPYLRFEPPGELPVLTATGVYRGRAVRAEGAWRIQQLTVSSD